MVLDDDILNLFEIILMWRDIYFFRPNQMNPSRYGGAGVDRSRLSRTVFLNVIVGVLADFFFIGFCQKGLVSHDPVVFVSEVGIG